MDFSVENVIFLALVSWKFDGLSWVKVGVLEENIHKLFLVTIRKCKGSIQGVFLLKPDYKCVVACKLCIEYFLIPCN